jgi:trk system potassium uptake protein
LSRQFNKTTRYQAKPGDRVLRIPQIEPWRIPVEAISQTKTGEPSLLTLVYGFGALIALGAFLLALPIVNNFGVWTSPINAVFTATSGVCVTGLAVVDTLDYWNLFGQIVILVLIQLGGFGFMTSTTVALVALGRRIGLRERLLIGESMGIGMLGGLLKIVRNMFLFTVSMEIIGTAAFYLRFSAQYSTGLAIWKSIFQSVSSFNNAGFDLFGGFQSMLNFQGDYLVTLTTAALIFLGGISFLVVQDVIKTHSLWKLSLDSKMVLSMTFVLLMAGMAVVFVTEYGNPSTLGSMSLPEKLLNAFFLSVTSRTAGFSTIPIGAMTHYALFFIMLLMFVGGASGSAAGGIKVNTLGLIVATIWSSIKGREHPGAFGKEFMNQQIFRALAVVIISTGLVCTVVFFLTITEKSTFFSSLFETISAFGTVGLSTGVTPDLSVIGRLLIIFTMFAGRLGPLTLTLTLVKRQKPTKYRYSREIVRLG